MTLIRIREEYRRGGYNARMAAKHGFLYIEIPKEFDGLCNAKSIATGEVCMFIKDHMEVASQ